MRLLSLIAAWAALVLAVAGCGGSPVTVARTTAVEVETPACRVLTSAAVDAARGLLRSYGGDPSPGDLPFYDLREALANVQARCRPQWLGGAMGRELSAHQIATLLSLLPSTYVAYLQRAFACSRAARPGAGCRRSERTIHSPGATGTGATPHPVAP